MRLRRAAAAATGTVVSALLLSGCGPRFDPLYVAANGEGAPLIGLRDCPGAEPDYLLDVTLYAWDDDADPALGKVLWSAVAPTSGARQHHVRLGSTPPGYRTRVPLRTTLRPATTYALRANTTQNDLVEGTLTFRPEQLRPDQVVFDESKAEPRSAYEARNEEDFGCYAR